MKKLTKIRRPQDGRRTIPLRREVLSLVERYAKRHAITLDTAVNELLRMQFEAAQR